MVAGDEQGVQYGALAASHGAGDEDVAGSLIATYQ